MYCVIHICGVLYVCNKLRNSVHAFGKHIQCTPKYFVLECISFQFHLFSLDTRHYIHWWFAGDIDWALACAGLQLNLRLYSMWSIRIYILRVLIERVQTFNNEIVCNQPNDIENVPKNTKNPEHTKNTTISQRSSSKSYKLCTCVCVHTH